MPKLTRRGFLRTAATAAIAAATGPTLVPARALGRDGGVAANSRMTLGAIGVGGMGRHDLGNFMTHPDVQVLAVCEVDRDRLNAAKQMVDETYENRDCAAYGDFRELLARPDIDLILIATPDHWHAFLAIAAAKAGKDVYCEKPISLTIAEGRAVAKAMKKYKRVYQSNTQRRNIDPFRLTVEAARKGMVGRIHTIHAYLMPGQAIGPQPEEPVPPGFNYDLWLGQAPYKPYTTKRCHGSFRWIFDYSGGQLTDIGAHFNDLAQLGHDSEKTGPISFEGWATFPKEGLYDTAVNFHVRATYRDDIRLEMHDTGPRAIRFDGDEGWISVDDTGLVEAQPASILKAIKAERVDWTAIQTHQRDFLEAVKDRRDPVAPPEIAHRSTTICHAANICLRLGRPLQWDPRRERFVKDDQANAMMSRPARAPWSLENAERIV